MSDRASTGASIDLPRGAAFMVTSAFLFAAMGVAVKLASQQLGNSMVVFVRSGLGLLMLLPWLLRLGAKGLATRHLFEHLVRGLAGLGAMYCFFYAIGHMRLADAVLLNYSLPLFAPFIESAWLGEPFPRRLWRGILIGFLGLLLILKPGLEIFDPVALVGLAAGMLAALAQVGVRRLTTTEPVTRIVFYFGVVSTLGSSVPAALAWTTPRVSLWPTLLLLGLTATIAQLFMTRAYSHAPAAQVGPFIYSSVVFAGLFDWALFAKLPDALTLAGAVLVAVAGIVTLKLAGPTPSEPEPAGL
jgi:drug/metabolite transporter (DMT)-like permease